MNLQKVKEIIEFYKEHFHEISHDEIYKWQAVKCFQDNWDIDAKDFTEMLKRSLSLTKNLLDSGQYFPKRMLLINSEKEPEKIKSLFVDLFDEDQDWIERIERFQNEFKLINKKHFPGTNSYQDHRAISVYSVLRFPDTYFLYKFTMFKNFIEKIEYPYKPVKGRIENLSIYSNVCELLREEIIKDKELLELHKSRLDENCYDDKESFNILTQDIIYAADFYFKKFEKAADQKPALQRLTKVERNEQPGIKSTDVVLKGSFTNYIENEKAKKRIGDLGELLVLQYEKERLEKLGVRKEPEHISKTRGDGEGYDILSYDESGKEIYIEVKTTTKHFNAPFFITRNELERSKINSDRFYLYRLYDFEDNVNTAKFWIWSGNLESLCTNPVLFQITFEESNVK